MVPTAASSGIEKRSISPPGKNRGGRLIEVTEEDGGAPGVASNVWNRLWPTSWSKLLHSSSARRKRGMVFASGHESEEEHLAK